MKTRISAVIDDATSQTYVAWRKRKITTMANELGPIRTALNWAVKNKLIDRAPKIMVPTRPDSEVPSI